jgi:hypothetical protein
VSKFGYACRACPPQEMIKKFKKPDEPCPSLRCDWKKSASSGSTNHYSVMSFGIEEGASWMFMFRSRVLISTYFE